MQKIIKLGLLLLLLLSGCGPVISRQLIQEAAPRVDFADLKSQPEKYRGKMLILGGEIVRDQQGLKKSLLGINQKELDAKLRPADEDKFGGMFLIQSEHWLSPGTYVPNRKITVAGVVLGQQHGLPLLQARQLYLWEHPDKLIAVPPEWYDNDPVMEYWYTPPYFNPWRTNGLD